MHDRLVWGLDRARQPTLALVADVPPDRACLQSAPGGRRALWILGHLLDDTHGFGPVQWAFARPVDP